MEWTVVSPPGRWFDLSLSELWAHRELLGFLVWRDVKVRYKQTLIGGAWAVIQPLATMLLFTLIFSRLAHLPTEGMPAPIFYFTGLLPWLYFSAALTNSANTIVEHQRVVTKVYFPRLILPLSGVLPGLVDFGVSFVVLIVLAMMMGVSISYTILLTPLFVILAMLAALGAGLWLSSLNALYRDFRYALPFFIQVLFFASPVIVPASFIPDRYQWILGLNPIAGAISGFRWAFTGVNEFPRAFILSGSIVTVGLLISGLLFFRRVEHLIADVV